MNVIYSPALQTPTEQEVDRHYRSYSCIGNGEDDWLCIKGLGALGIEIERNKNYWVAASLGKPRHKHYVAAKVSILSDHMDRDLAATITIKRPEHVQFRAGNLALSLQRWIKGLTDYERRLDTTGPVKKVRTRILYLWLETE